MSELKVVREFRSDLLAAQARMVRPRWRRRGLVVPAVAVAVVATGAALAATRTIEIGSPIKAPHPPRFRGARPPLPGVPVARSVRLAAVRAPDPAGGPPWSLRTFRTRNGWTCTQIGRVVDGRLGLIGLDGKFHELPLASYLAACAGGLREPPSPTAPVLSNGYLLTPAVGVLGSAGLSGCDAYAERRAAAQGRPVTLCDDNRLRSILFGTVGAHVSALVVEGAGPVRSVRIGPDREYVIALAGGSRGPSHVDAVYDDGRVRRAFPIPRRPEPPFSRPAAHLRPRVPTRVSPGAGSAQTTFDISWRAPVAVGRARSLSYRVEGPGGDDCKAAFSAAFPASARDARPGRSVTLRLAPPGPSPRRWCPGVYRGEISLGDRGTIGSFRFTVR